MLDTSPWNFQGCAVSGAAAGKCLDRIPALKDCWFDWRNYHPDTTVFERYLAGLHSPDRDRLAIEQAAGPAGGILSAIQGIFWDVGGVLLTNAWDHNERKDAIEHFQLEEKEFQARHELVVSSFERGKISLDEYLSNTVFYRERTFSREEFRDYMFALSKPKPEVLDFARALAESGRYFMSTINNESRELNLYRLDKFELRKIFRLFVSSCFVGLRKPESGIYRLALETTQIEPQACCFIDDRALNLECAAALGMRAIRMQNLEQLRGELEKMAVST